ncbi:uncharacterized protein [Cherax quadricarinatus]|uniref:uncharacterized protein n=1 Tax=Cherax quadricarinatus TaxID=27406 RepID=UPI00387EB19E
MKVSAAVILIALTGVVSALPLCERSNCNVSTCCSWCCTICTNTTTTTPPPSTSKPPMMPYDFKWDVNNPDSGNVFSHVEKNDGHTMMGEYRVLLPDGRTQVVNFTDSGKGLKALVTNKHQP